jgi:beta-lactamase superfamily II metal-dependent hydrolase
MAGSADPNFLAMVRPRVAVISASWHVPAYLPDDAVVARLGAASGRLLRTDDDGEICLELSRDSDMAQDC